MEYNAGRLIDQTLSYSALAKKTELKGAFNTVH